MGAGVLRIHGGGKYSVNGGKKGKYSTSGKKIKFKTGDYSKSHRGKWSKDGSTYKVGLFKKSDTSTGAS